MKNFRKVASYLKLFLKMPHGIRLLFSLLFFPLALFGCVSENPSSASARSTVSIGNGTEPQWIYQNEPHSDVALVFVHGIFGDTIRTWTNSNGESLFHIVENDPFFGKRVGIFAFGFTSNMFKSGSLRIQEAADVLHAQLKFHHVLDYPKIVFVAHSMGGLVVMRELLTHRELLGRVPAMVFYATPQEGSEIASIAKYIARNPALEEMIPGDKNGYLSLLDSEWKSIPSKERPVIECAYEKKPMYGKTIVDRSSATRFCDGPSIGIAEDHVGIVKPDNNEHGSVILLINTLSDYVFGDKGEITPAQKLEIEMWRASHAFGKISGSALISIGMPDNGHIDGLNEWLNRVAKRYAEAKKTHQMLPKDVSRGDGISADEYLEINAVANPKLNWDLAPRGEKERFVKELIFEPALMFMPSKDNTRVHLLTPLVTVNAKAESVKVFFDPVTHSPTRIEAFSAGDGDFKPLSGEFTNWLDLYGATIIVRPRLTVYPRPELLALVHFDSLSFTTQNNFWQATASFSQSDKNATVDRPGSLLIENADWTALGSVPNDYPGYRSKSFGPLTRIQ
jgi:hypothetical protein